MTVTWLSSALREIVESIVFSSKESFGKLDNDLLALKPTVEDPALVKQVFHRLYPAFLKGTIYSVAGTDCFFDTPRKHNLQTITVMPCWNSI